MRRRARSGDYELAVYQGMRSDTVHRGTEVGVEDIPQNPRYNIER